MSHVIAMKVELMVVQFDDDAKNAVLALCQEEILSKLQQLVEDLKNSDPSTACVQCISVELPSLIKVDVAILNHVSSRSLRFSWWNPHPESLTPVQSTIYCQ
jgi:hypothetical protein